MWCIKTSINVSVQARYVELASQYEECWPDKACKTQVNFRRAETPRLALAGTGTETTATISNADTDSSLAVSSGENKK